MDGYKMLEDERFCCTWIIMLWMMCIEDTCSEVQSCNKIDTCVCVYTHT